MSNSLQFLPSSIFPISSCLDHSLYSTLADRESKYSVWKGIHYAALLFLCCCLVQSCHDAKSHPKLTLLYMHVHLQFVHTSTCQSFVVGGGKQRECHLLYTQLNSVVLISKRGIALSVWSSGRLLCSSGNKTELWYIKYQNVLEELKNFASSSAVIVLYW